MYVERSVLVQDGLIASLEDRRKPYQARKNDEYTNNSTAAHSRFNFAGR